MTGPARRSSLALTGKAAASVSRYHVPLSGAVGRRDGEGPGGSAADPGVRRDAEEGGYAGDDEDVRSVWSGSDEGGVVEETIEEEGVIVPAVATEEEAAAAEEEKEDEEDEEKGTGEAKGRRGKAARAVEEEKEAIEEEEEIEEDEEVEEDEDDVVEVSVQKCAPQPKRTRLKRNRNSAPASLHPPKTTPAAPNPPQKDASPSAGKPKDRPATRHSLKCTASDDNFFARSDGVPGGVGAVPSGADGSEDVVDWEPPPLNGGKVAPARSCKPRAPPALHPGSGRRMSARSSRKEVDREAALIDIGRKKDSALREGSQTDGGGIAVSKAVRGPAGPAGAVIAIDDDDDDDGGDDDNDDDDGERDGDGDGARGKGAATTETGTKRRRGGEEERVPLSAKRRSKRQAMRKSSFFDADRFHREESARMKEAAEIAKRTEQARAVALAEAETERKLDEARTQEEKQLAEISVLPRRELFLYPPDDTRGRVAITSDDAARLNPGCYLNDSLVDFYIKYVDRMMVPVYMEADEPIFCFSSFFFGRLRQAVNPIDYAGVQRWTKYANDLFTKRFVFVPVCDSHHWSLIVIANLDRLPSCIEKGEFEGDLVDRPSIVYVDSLGAGTRGNSFAKIAKTYLVEEWLFRKEKNGVTGAIVDPARERAIRKSIDAIVRIVKPRVPMQTNEFDCGLYLLWNIVEFVRNRDGFRERCLDRKAASDHSSPSLFRFYTHSIVLSLRDTLKSLVDTLTPENIRKLVANDIEERDARVEKFKQKLEDEAPERDTATAALLEESRRTAEDEALARALCSSREEDPVASEEPGAKAVTEQADTAEVELTSVEKEPDVVESDPVEVAAKAVERRPGAVERRSEAVKLETEVVEMESEAVGIVTKDMSGEAWSPKDKKVGKDAAATFASPLVVQEATHIMAAERLVMGVSVDGAGDDFDIPMAGRSERRVSAPFLSGASPAVHHQPFSAMLVPAGNNDFIQAIAQQSQPSRTRRLTSAATGSAPMAVPEENEASTFPVTVVSSPHNMDIVEDGDDEDLAMDVTEPDDTPMDIAESLDTNKMEN
jgi:Ulp1 protease family, C-terminal catalytic domain